MSQFNQFGPGSGVNPYNAAQATPGLSDMPGTQQGDQEAQQRQIGGQPISFWVLCVVLLFVLKWASEREGTKLEPAHLYIGGYNVASIVIAWLVGFGLLKFTLNRFLPASGATAFVNFV
jgi:hypothetical protein